MNYCEKCHILFEVSPCPRCGYRHVRPPKEDDYVFLAEKEYPWSEVLEGALKDAGIAVATNDAVVGAWITARLGPRFERSQLFVPHGALKQAEEIMAQLFNEENFEWEE